MQIDYIKQMRLTLFIALLFYIQLSHSQTYEIGGMIGGANYIGDVGSTQYINPNTFMAGGLFRWNRSPRHSFRFSATYAKIKADDADSHETRREQRGYSFNNTIKELSLGLEFTFWEFDTHSDGNKNTPYLYSGISYFNYDSLFLDENNQMSSNGNDWAFAIPMAIGYKTTLGSKMVLGVEVGARYTFTNNLDGSYPSGELSEIEELRFGNLKSNDWYVFTGINLTFMFGRKPCYCPF